MTRAGPERRARFVVVALCAVLGYWVVLTTAWNAKASMSGSPLFALVPEDPKLTFDQAMRTMRSTKGAATPRLLPSVDEAAELDPIDGRPLFLHAFDQLLTAPGSLPLAELEASRHLNPRLTETRLLLLDLYGRHGRAGDAVREAQALVTLLPSHQTLMVRLVAGLAGLRGGPEALAQTLPRSPIKGDVMLRLAQTGADRALLERLARPMRGIARDHTQRNWISALVSNVAQRPDVPAARSLWGILYAVDPRSIGTQVANPDFAGEENPPFGWGLSRSGAGVAQIHDGLLDVYYYGRADAVFVSQTLVLSPGAYRLTSRVRSTDAEPPQGLAWQIACVEGGAPLARVSLAALLAAKTAAPSFTIPSSGCSAQTLQLAGTAADMSSSQSAQVDAVVIARASS